MNKKAVFIAIVLALILAGGVYYYFTMAKLQFDIEPLKVEENKNENDKNGDKNQQKDETADWKTYRNEEYGFEFKYPRNWKIVDNTIKNDLSIGLSLLIIMGKNASEQTGNLSIAVDTPPDIFEEQFKTIIRNIGEDSLEESNFTSNNLNGKFYILTHKNGTQIDYIYDYALENKNMRLAFYSYLKDNKRIIKDDFKKGIDLMVKTFKKIK